jgi:hypothetical protein
VQSRVEASLEAIRPNQEYKDFTEKHKYSEYLLDGSGGMVYLNTSVSFSVNWGHAKLCQETFIYILLDLLYIFMIRFFLYVSS